MAERKFERVDAYTDGACSGNPGPGGWGVLLRHDKGERELMGGTWKGRRRSAFAQAYRKRPRS